MCSRIPVDQLQWREAQLVHLGAADASALVPALVVLALLLGIQPITTDLCLPSLSRGDGATMASIRLAQLFCGPLSDRFGRRPILLWGLDV